MVLKVALKGLGPSFVIHSSCWYELHGTWVNTSVTGREENGPVA